MQSDLKLIPILSELEEAELAAMAKVLRHLKAEKGEHLILYNDEGQSLTFVKSGRLKVSLVNDEGKEIILKLLNTGEFFGEIALLTGEKRTADVVALSACELFILSEADFRKHIENYTGLTHALLRALAFRLRAASAKIGDLALYDVYRRLARTLQELSEERDEAGALQNIIDKRPTHQELATMVGTSREMITRALKTLEDEGYIVVNGKQIEVVGVPGVD